MTPSRKKAPSKARAKRRAKPKPSGEAPRYAQAGVDLERDESFVERIKEISRTTLRPEVLASVGGFAGLFKAPERYEKPIFVASADGVGTKLKLAAAVGRFDTVGIDCVAMVVNDLVVQGAEPLVVLDYLAFGEMDEERAEEALRGIAEGCRRAGCALLGGETATMPGVYAPGELELVGFGLGVVERDRVIDGSAIGEGDVLLGLASGGLHSNGFALVRQLLGEWEAAGKCDLMSSPAELNTTVASALLAPTRIYVKPILNLVRDFNIKGIVHVTGGGFVGNVPRILPKGVRARIELHSWPRPAVFKWLASQGEISEREMLRVFNCGIGMVVVLPRDEVEDARDRLRGLGERAHVIGRIERKESNDPPLLFEPAPGE